MKKYDAVVAFAFGLPASLKTNRAILNRAVELGKILGVPIFAEGTLNEGHYRDVVRYSAVFSALSHAFQPNYSSTVKFAAWLAMISLVRDSARHARKKVLVVAALAHVKRCMRDLRKYGFEPEADNYFREHDINLYDKESEQMWTRAAWLFLPREIILRLLPWRIYKWITLR